MLYVELEGAVHAIEDDEQTFCGLVVPHGTPWVTPEGSVHCGPDAKAEPVETPKPNSKAKAKK